MRVLPDAYSAMAAGKSIPYGRNRKIKRLRNLRTIIHEAEENGGSKYVNQVLDCLWVMENAMRIFLFWRKDKRAPLSEVNEYYKEAARLGHWWHHIGIHESRTDARGVATSLMRRDWNDSSFGV